MDATSQIIKFLFLDVPTGATYFLVLPVLLVEERWPGCFTRPSSAMRVPHGQEQDKRTISPSLTCTCHNTASVCPGRALGFCISSPVLGIARTPSCLGAHRCRQVGNASVCMTSGCAGWDCSSASQPNSPPGAEDQGLDEYIPLDLYSH